MKKLLALLSIFLFTACVSSQEQVKLYYYNPEKDGGAGNIACSENGLDPVFRILPKSETIIEDTIRLLLKGEITESEKAKGITSEYPLKGFELVDSNLVDGVLTLEFADPEGKTGGGSCRVIILWGQIKATAKQFPEVKEVKIKPEGVLFQP